MRIALIGYGKMGHEIEQIALSRQHSISFKITQHNKEDLTRLHPNNTDVAIEFTQPEAAYEHLRYCLENHIPVVSGTTGWLAHKAAIEQLCTAKKGSFFYASNFSIGVNLFFQVNEYLAQLMAKYEEYNVHIEEVHHTEKKDAPSGTAITLAEGILKHYPKKQQWVNKATTAEEELGILSQRLPEVPGTHSIHYQSAIDDITIEHIAHSRRGFALGAVIAAEFTSKHPGIWGMKDLLQLDA
ncbi:MAG: 4-hydroxy-tetrahydrodipicolinate reductase [Bacteroidota bacterium]